MKKPALLIMSLTILIIVLAIVRTFVANNISTSGVVLGKIEEKVEQYKLENSILAEQLYSMSSLTNISQKAYDLGYGDETSDLVLTQNKTVALKQ
jgi:hypothetical protein